MTIETTVRRTCQCSTDEARRIVTMLRQLGHPEDALRGDELEALAREAQLLLRDEPSTMGEFDDAER